MARKNRDPQCTREKVGGEEIIWKTHRLMLKYKVKVKVTQSYLTLCDPMDCSLPGSSVHGILQARILEWVAVPFSSGSSQHRHQTQVSCTADRFFTVWATREAQKYWSGLSIPSPAHLPNPGIKQGFPALQVYSLPADLPGKLVTTLKW